MAHLLLEDHDDRDDQDGEEGGIEEASTVPPATEPRTRPRVPKSKPPNPSPVTNTARPAGSLGGWLLRESIALLGMAGAALTVFSQLAWTVPLSRPFIDILGWWMTVTSNFWLTHYDTIGFYPHTHLQAAIALAAFLALIGLGARISTIVSGTPLQRRWGFLDGMTWPSLAIMGVLAIIFLLGHDPEASTASYDGAGGKETVKYLFAIILTVGYAAGDYLGQRGFHVRLYRLAVLLILGLGLNQWLLSSY
ncbi:hypothetical protein [Phenylobacterium sp.]|uniref:hypothetical protein n=1 Tax=Phenylobacterium sp. TaxID=1871053 RepID=UPI00286D4DD3|nr:hypothetical protein [Phenylobacterium sp.]